MSIALRERGGAPLMRRLALIAVAFAAMALAALPAQAGSFTQQGAKLVGLGAVGAANQGWSVALSADGNTAIVGGVGDNSSAGAVWVYIRDGNGVWAQQGAKRVGSGVVGNANQGYSVALSADGNTAIVGGTTDNSFAGAVWVFTRDSNGVWTQQGAKLVGSGAVGAARQGTSVALSADGNTAIVGGEGDSSNAGAAWVYIRDGNGVWTQQGAKLTFSGAVGSARRGISVALSADGNTAIVGGWGDNSVDGAAWVFTRDGNGVWTQQGAKLVGSGAVGQAGQGYSVALSADGNTAIVGGVLDNGNAGAVWVFIRDNNGVWTQQGAKLVGSGAVGVAAQGFSVALSADGNTAIVGGSADNGNAGAAWAFGRSRAGVWTQLKKLVGTGASGIAQQGWSVALSADSNTAIVGGNRDNSYAGAAWVFGRPAIHSITPDAGSVAGGEEVVLFGTNLFNVTSVTFGGVAAINVTPIDAETAIATTPPHAAGKVDVIVSTQTSGSTRLRRGFTYEPYPTVTYLVSSLNPSTVGQNVTFTAFVSGGGLQASGQVTFKDGTQTLGTVSLTNGRATFSTTALAAGRHRIKALFQRNGMFSASRDSLSQRVR